ncbi:hypothetical protein CANARDRAFT_201888 [[Candida] arabinofermentans NRRL YB-2248]|uniref:Exoribonuclease phosphorolytic domain-containing protein n=1 Tax=[Candida] arabinofermentans NRRL YB-2248 TaxID=983967 RepID=A0A1E4SWX1_9ASCO|nr:hypothetical protein CANARDRAFT_201888 [[Candida] arabinofermentans NRRL YB-2248]
MSSININTGILEQVDGSCIFQINSTKIISSVTGPIESSRIKNEIPTRAYLDINIIPEKGVSSTRESLLETKLNKILKPMINLNLYPRQSIQIVIQVLKSGEFRDYSITELSTIVNCVYISLLNSGISLKSSFLSSCCVILQNNEIKLNPTIDDLKSCKSNHIAVFNLKNAKTDELIYCDSLGSFSDDQFFKVLNYCATDIEHNNEFIRKSIANTIEKDYIWKFQ